MDSPSGIDGDLGIASRSADAVAGGGSLPDAFDSAVQAMAWFDAEGRYLRINEAYADLLGCELAAPIGLTPRRWSARAPESELDLSRLGESHRGGWAGVVTRANADGGLNHYWLQLRGVRGVSGAFEHWVSAVSDIGAAIPERPREDVAFDSLTGLPTRVLLGERLERALAQAREDERKVAIAYLDLSGLKQINHQIGHAAGDDVLSRVAQRMQQSVRHGDTVARLGGDEFVIVLAGLEDIMQGQTVLARLLNSVGAPIELAGGRSVQVAGNLGVTYFPLDDRPVYELLKHADSAMQQARNGGANRFYVYDAAVEQREFERAQLRAEFELALQRDELCLFFEPQIDMRAGRVLGAEALLRWQHPQRGLLAPGAFLSVIEDEDTLVRLGNWVLSTACRKLESWKQDDRELTLCVNLSAQHIQREDFYDRLADLLDEFDPSIRDKLRLEIIETASVASLDELSLMMERCCELGPSFSLDDFGTGSSSLTYLRQLPVDVVKIDRSFVAGLLDVEEDRSLVQGIIALTRVFGRQAFAEGVESEEHALALLALGCDAGQGYGIARAMPEDRFEQWLADFSTSAWASLGQRYEAGTDTD